MKKLVFAQFNDLFKYIIRNNKLNGNYVKQSFYINHNILNYYDMIFDKTKFLNSEASLEERIYCIHNNIISRKTCKYCNKYVVFNGFNTGYTPTCGKKCGIKIRKTFLEPSICNIIEKSKLINFINKELYNGSYKPLIYKTKYWFYKNNRYDYYYSIYYYTKILPISSSLLERVYFLKNNFLDRPKCIYCNNYVHFFKCKGIPNYTKICGSTSCRSKLSHDSNIGRKLSNYTKHQISIGNTGKILSHDTKLKIKNSNILTSSTLEHKTKMENSWKKYNVRERLSKLMKEKILNGTFTPQITNSWANSKCKLYINNQYYRSSWEAAFHILNPSCNFEKLRIKYLSPIDNTEHIYIVDFIDYQSKNVYEIKPNSELSNVKNIAKSIALKKWCELNGYTYNLISNNYFYENAIKIDYNKYDPKIKKGMIQFL